MTTYKKKRGLDIKRYNEIKRLRGLNYKEFENEMILIFDEIERLKKKENFFMGKTDNMIDLLEQQCGMKILRMEGNDDDKKQ